ncbi:MAG TPA: BrnT family toxin [Reyranella sp.]|nr:BrnT family toxin [Reyranella sp.]
MGHVVHNGQRFEWDDTKRRRVLREHGVDLERLPRMFNGPIIEDFDAAHSDSEDRWRIIGMLDDRCIVAVYTRRNAAIRLITARPAEPHEETEFEIMLIGEALPDDPT